MKTLGLLAFTLAAVGCSPNPRAGATPAKGTDPNASADPNAPSSKGILLDPGRKGVRHHLQYRVGPDAAWWLRSDKRRTVTAPGYTPFTEHAEVVLRIDRRGVSPDGSLRYAIALVRGTASANGGPLHALPTFAGLAFTTAMTVQGGWMESRWEIPPDAPKAAVVAARRVEMRLSLPLPTNDLGLGAKWKVESENAPSMDLRTTFHMEDHFTLVDADDNQAELSLDEVRTAPTHELRIGNTTIAVEGEETTTHGTFVVRFDRLISEATATMRAKWPLRHADGAANDAGAVTELIEETLTTIPPPEQ